MDLADLITMKALVVLLLATILLSLVILEAIDSGMIVDEDACEVFRRRFEFNDSMM